MDYAITLATPHQLPAGSDQLVRTLYPPAAPIDGELESPHARLWLACARAEGDRPVAFLLALHVDDALHVVHLGTDPAHQKRGIGARLLDAAIDHLAAARGRTLFLEVRASNEAAIRLYRRAGFSAFNVRKNYYGDPPEDALEMRLVLDLVSGKKLQLPDDV